MIHGPPETLRSKWQKFRARVLGCALTASLTVTTLTIHPQPPLQSSGALGKKKNINLSEHFRQCDSRNLNLSPFCGLKSSSALKLQPTLEATYRESSVETSYVQDLKSPLRREYPSRSMASEEILSILTTVCPHPLSEELSCSFLQGDPKYNAYKRDIAVVNLFFGDSAVFGKSFCLLWRNTDSFPICRV